MQQQQQQQQQQPSVVMYSGRGESCSMEGRIGGGGRVTEAYRMTSSGFLRRSSIEHIAWRRSAGYVAGRSRVEQGQFVKRGGTSREREREREADEERVDDAEKEEETK